MRILIVGSGGREHALSVAIARSKQPSTLFCIGENAGIAEIASMVSIPLSDHEGILLYAKKQAIEFAVIGPDEALVQGLADVFENAGIPCFGPSKRASQLEGSKSYAKAFMVRNHIPTPSYTTCTTYEAALAALSQCSFPVVIKADGLALGKGVVIAQDHHEAEDALKAMMVDKIFASSGETVVIEEFVSGEEVSLLVLSDGTVAKPLVSCMDHKRAYDGDQGPNTGGMGVIAPNPFYTEAVASQCMQSIVMPTIESLKREGSPFVGCLFFGLMLTPDGPVVIEYNCRFGDPEAQVALSLIEGDVLSLLLSCRYGTLASETVICKEGSACSVTLASGGYPHAYERGKIITIDPLASSVFLFHGGTRKTDTGVLVTNGGRVMHVLGVGMCLQDAIESAYRGVGAVSFEGKQYRRDIGKKALQGV
ncbi:MAG: phosphoribosylamine--glycine ligase [Sphaerochaeta sp.]